MEELQAELKGKETQITEIKDQIREKDSRIDFCHTQVMVCFICFSMN